MKLDDPAFAHFGRLGMKWGVRRSPQELTSNTPPAHSEDAKRHQDSLNKISTGGTHALSDKEFQDVVSRIRLQQQYSDLITKPKQKAAILRGHDAVKAGVGIAATGVTIYNLANHPAAKAGLKVLKEALKTAGKHAAKNGAAVSKSTALVLA